MSSRPRKRALICHSGVETAVKYNFGGMQMPVSASKLVTLAQLQAQAERVKQELAKYTLASELGSLAKKERNFGS